MRTRSRDRDALGQQALQHALHLARGQQGRGQLLDHDGVGAAHRLDEGLDVLAPEQAGGVGLDDLGQVGDQDARPVDDRRAVQLGLLAGLDGTHLPARPNTGSVVTRPGTASRLSPIAST